MTHEDVWPGNCVVIMKEEMKYAGPFGLALKLGGSLFIKRKDSASAKETLRSAVDAILANEVSELNNVEMRSFQVPFTHL